MRYVFTIILLVLCAGAHTALAVDVTAVHFRAAGVDVASQKYVLQWYYPNPADTAAVKEVRLLLLRTDELQNVNLDIIDIVGNQVKLYLADTFTCCAPQSFALRLIDTSPTSPAVTTDLFRTMQLGEPVLDSCANAINLQWSDYLQLDKDGYKPVAEFTDSVRYHIYGYAGESIFEPDSVAWLASAGSATSYALPVVKEKKYHHLLVAAVYNGGRDTSFSNRVQLHAQLPLRPQHMSLDSVVVDERSTALRFRIDPNTEYRRFWVEKSSDANVGFEQVAELDGKAQTSAQLSGGGSSITFYRISAVNSCMRVVASSPVATTLGVVVRSSGRENSVGWNAISYNGFGATYSVHRTAPPEYATSLGSVSESSKVDDLSLLPDSAVGATFCYAVEALVRNSSAQNLCYVRSAEVCSAITPQVYMPNAVQPGSDVQNPLTGKSRGLFEPVSSYALTYTLYVYARSGRLVYSGSEAWNGRENNSGELVDEGSYAYLIKVAFVGGKRVEKAGNVTVVY